MKSFYSFSFFMLLSGWFLAGAQNVNNAGFENWENVGAITEEPNDWNSFKSASGSAYLLAFAQQQIKRSTVVRPGSSGSYSAVIWSKLVYGVIANGNFTTGQVNMGNVIATHQDNYNITRTADANFSEAFSAHPDSLVFWTKFVPANSGGTDSARMKAIYHDAYDYRDPSTGDVNAPSHVYATATINFPTTSNQWIRKAVPFIYSGPTASGTYMLITFTTNKTPGVGTDGDSLYIDDLEMIYNGVGILDPIISDQFAVFADPINNQLIIDLNFDNSSNTKISLYNISGQLILSSEKEISVSREQLDLNGLDKGIYLLEVTRANGVRFVQKFAVR